MGGGCASGIENRGDQSDRATHYKSEMVGGAEWPDRACQGLTTIQFIFYTIFFPIFLSHIFLSGLLPYISVSHISVRSSSLYFCLTYFCPVFFPIFLSRIFLSGLLPYFS